MQRKLAFTTALVASLSLAIVQPPAMAADTSRAKPQTNKSTQPHMAASKSNWSYSQTKDKMRGTTTRFAQVRSRNSLQFDFPYQGGSRGILNVRDKAGELDIYLVVERGQFVCNDFGNDTIAAKFDNGEIQEFHCGESSSGDTNVIFIGNEDHFFEELLKSSRLIIEALFFQEGKRQLTFDVQGLNWAAPESVKIGAETPPAATVSTPTQAAARETKTPLQIEGIRSEVADELNRWGPRNISVNKRILSSLGVYSGPLDSSIEPAFALAVQTYYDAYIAQCRAGKSSGINCTSLRAFSSYGVKPIMPPIGAVIYETAPPTLQQEAGKLFIND